jgi:membrane-associated phospholipid phosphatase
MAIMYLMPLDPPSTMITLHDPFVELYGSGLVLTRDLFFSGHTATLFLIALALPTARQRAFGLAVTTLVGVGVLFQHAHYSADVLAAPFFSYACYRLAARLVGPRPDPSTQATHPQGLPT